MGLWGQYGGRQAESRVLRERRKQRRRRRGGGAGRVRAHPPPPPARTATKPAHARRHSRSIRKRTAASRRARALTKEGKVELCWPATFGGRVSLARAPSPRTVAPMKALRLQSVCAIARHPTRVSLTIIIILLADTLLPLLATTGTALRIPPERRRQVLRQTHCIRPDVLAERLDDRLERAHEVLRVDLVHERKDRLEQAREHRLEQVDVRELGDKRAHRHDRVHFHGQLAVVHAMDDALKQGHKVGPCPDAAPCKGDVAVGAAHPSSLGAQVSVRGQEARHDVRHEHRLELLLVRRLVLEHVRERPSHQHGAVHAAGEYGRDGGGGGRRRGRAGRRRRVLGKHPCDVRHHFAQVRLGFFRDQDMQKVGRRRLGAVHVLDHVVALAHILLRVVLPQLGVGVRETHQGEND
jgi:hypothetical protein